MTAFKVLAIAILSCLTSGCGKTWGKVTCGDAFSCVQLEYEVDPACLVAGRGDSRDRRWVAKNYDDNGKTIYLTYRVDTQYKHQTKPDDSHLRMVAVKTTASRPLTCERDNFTPPEAFDVHALTKEIACYEGECPSPPPSPPVNPRPAGVTCEAACKLGSGMDCVKLAVLPIPGAPQSPHSVLRTLNQGIIKEPLPAAIKTADLVALINAAAGTTSCTRDDILMASGQSPGAPAKFVNDGTSCALQFTLVAQDFQSVQVAFNGRWSGALRRDVSSYTMLSNAAPYSPVITVVTKDGVTEQERISEISGTQKDLLLTGEHKYCALISWSD